MQATLHHLASMPPEDPRLVVFICLAVYNAYSSGQCQFRVYYL